MNISTVVSRAALAVVALISSAQPSAAQTSTTPTSAWELRFTSGALVPVGEQRNSLKDAQMSAAQLSWVVRPSLAITGTFGWARSRDLASVDTPKLDVFSSDVGVELRGTEWFADRAMTLKPFAGLGAGARSYNYRNLNVDATNNLAGYGTVGGELGVGRVGVRLEVRDYVTGFKPLAGTGTPATRNDVMMMLGFRFNRHTSR
ncbi:MAG: hypothetical protein JWL61_3445 [Gemmatimonadetes bacterium]|nr:hypothetical protein [Gemmatimonadota bacterium]